MTLCNSINLHFLVFSIKIFRLKFYPSQLRGKKMKSKNHFQNIDSLLGSTDSTQGPKFVDKMNFGSLSMHSPRKLELIKTQINLLLWLGPKKGEKKFVVIMIIVMIVIFIYLFLFFLRDSYDCYLKRLNHQTCFEEPISFRWRSSNKL